ncbi:hypothetical protein F0562_026543 [Nyssa sinensis]|uniref:Alpha/beta hydrolase fold-3 domain-containing protein n=1 Tax=Nyssa sinensis TaxID=561372 RepID=A0A5J5BFB0_9ASTE|nr:hypothetical protein F0562_026543 [Nyssa sinensis]
MSDQTASTTLTVDSNESPFIVRNPDGSITRQLISPSTSATVDPSHPSPVLTRDVTLNQSNDTWLRIFLPRHAPDSSPPCKLPLVVYYHGGGFIFCSAASTIFHDFCTIIATEIPSVVVSVEYRLAPEHRLPAAYDDCVEALHWIKTSDDEWLTKFADFSNCYLMGTSAGGNIAYHTGLRAAATVDDLEPLKIKGLILHHPFFGGTERTGSEMRLANDKVLPVRLSDLMWDLGLPIGADRDHEYSNPTVGGGSQLCDQIGTLGWKVMVMGCDGDPLINRQIELGKMLEEKGVQVVAVLISLCSLLFPSSPGKHKKKLPPGPPTIPIISNFLWLRKSFFDLEPILRDLRRKHGPVITLWIGSRPAIFVGSHSVAHQALFQKGFVFADRPKPPATGRILNINSAAYGPTWRLLRRNLTSEILHPSRVKSYSSARRWVLGILMDCLLNSESQQSQSAEVMVVDHFRYAMFCLLTLLCFGNKLDEKQIKQIETAQRQLILSFGRFNVLNFWPKVGKILFRNRWKELIEIRQNQEAVLIPLIKARKEVVRQRQHQQQEGKQKEEGEDQSVVAYVDTLVDLELPDEKRKVKDGEIVSLCGEFLTAGTDTTSTALEWIMANLLKYPRVQAKLYEEISGVVGPPPSPRISGKEQLVVVTEEELQMMPYLKAVVLEGLRRHPPGHFVLPHSVTEDVELNGYIVPKNATVNFMVAEMGWDPKVWDDPMEFKPERFFSAGVGEGEVFDVTGSREIKMMPFGAGRRICPGFGLALLHLEYFVANLIWYFEWTAVDDVDLSEKFEFTVVMKNPLRAHISPRTKEE